VSRPGAAYQGEIRGPYAKRIKLMMPLTERQKEVLTLIADGLSNAEIGLLLDISGGTVMRHARTIAQKLRVSGCESTRTASVAVALRKHIIT